MSGTTRPRHDALRRGPGPAYTVNAKPGVGFTSAQPWVFDVDAAVGDRVSLSINDTGLDGRLIQPDDILQYATFCVFDADEPDVRDSYAATSSSLELTFDDGTTLSSAGVRDTHGIGADPAARLASRSIAVDQWMLTSIPLRTLASRRIDHVSLLLEVPRRVSISGSGRRRLRGYVDTIRIVDAETVSPAEVSDPVNWVRTTRGTQSSDRFSRGNCAPLVGQPHGFVFGLPMTDGGNRGWPYSYHEANDATNTSRLQAFATSHIPSPWMGDRGVFQFFPSIDAIPAADRVERSQTFSHDDEIDRPDRYSVQLGGGAAAGGLDVEITTGCWSVWMRTRFPGDVGSIIFDQIDGDGRLDLSEASSAVITGYVDGPGGLVEVPRTYVYAEVDVPVTGARMHPHKDRADVLGSISVDVSRSRVATLAVAVSHISIEQARRNLQHDVELAERATAGLDAADGFDQIRYASHASWADLLGRVQVTGASADQLITVYSNLYRAYLYPNVGHENTGSVESPGWRYADPFVTAPADTPTQTGRPVVDGTLTVTDGFWDSYRASWPLRTLITPRATAMLLNGFVEHYRQGGWTSRWSAPGPADIMTGTSSDAVFTDAALAGVPGFDEIDAYDSCLRNATTPSENPRVGRKGMSRSIFRGFTDTDTFEGMSWTIDAAINDFAIAAFSRHLAGKYPQHPRHNEFVDNATWFTARATTYANVFDVDTGFFRGKHTDGGWRTEPFDPRNWGLDYTETNAWGTRFTAPHDGTGLVALYGGRERFEEALDDFSALQETGRDEFRGWYPVVIHEMREARDTRMGMLALSNQPAHHIPFMYHYASRPGSLAHAKAQRLIRDAVDRLFLGSDAGQGYPGDEDNGEMSSWYLWAVSGLYPLTIGTGCYVLGAPAFPRIRWTLDNGAVLDIEASGAGPESPYVQQVWIDGQTWDEITVPRSRLADGAHIRVDVGPEPSTWAQGSVPPSLTPDGQMPTPPIDLTSPNEAGQRALGVPTAAAAFDDNSSSESVELAVGDVIGWRFEEPKTVDHYTVTPTRPGHYSWRLEAAGDDGQWTELDRRSVDFRWPRQTRIFRSAGHDDARQHSHAYRLIADTAMDLAQLELFRLDPAGSAGEYARGGQEQKDL